MSLLRLALLSVLLPGFAHGVLAAEAEALDSASPVVVVSNPPPALKASVKGDDFVGNRTISHAYVSYGDASSSIFSPLRKSWWSSMKVMIAL